MECIDMNNESESSKDLKIQVGVVEREGEREWWNATYYFVKRIA